MSTATFAPLPLLHSWHWLPFQQRF